MFPPDLFIEKYDFAPSEAVMVGTQAHTAPAAFGKVMAMTRPRMAVAYHFQNDADTAPRVLSDIRSTYDGPVSLATDFMVWNVTKERIRVRMAVPNHESYPPPIQRKKQAPDAMKAYTWDPFSFSGMEPETAKLINRIVDDFNRKFGTNVEPQLTGKFGK
ncbi:MAG: hypothetical protein ACYTG3_04250 [Planctomycetota bacterium]